MLFLDINEKSLIQKISGSDYGSRNAKKEAEKSHDQCFADLQGPTIRNAYSIKYCISVNKHKILCLWVKKGNVEHIIYLTFKVYFRVYPDNKSFFLIPY